jgi:hypothetical protein
MKILASLCAAAAVIALTPDAAHADQPPRIGLGSRYTVSEEARPTVSLLPSGLQLRVRVLPRLSLELSYDLLHTTEIVDITWPSPPFPADSVFQRERRLLWQLDLAAHYRFVSRDRLDVYVLGGGGLTYEDIESIDSDGDHAPQWIGVWRPRFVGGLGLEQRFSAQGAQFALGLEARGSARLGTGPDEGGGEGPPALDRYALEAAVTFTSYF